jgi:hypothetical protein
VSAAQCRQYRRTVATADLVIRALRKEGFGARRYFADRKRVEVFSGPPDYRLETSVFLADFSTWLPLPGIGGLICFDSGIYARSQVFGREQLLEALVLRALFRNLPEQSAEKIQALDAWIKDHARADDSRQLNRSLSRLRRLYRQAVG